MTDNTDTPDFLRRTSAAMHIAAAMCCQEEALRAVRTGRYADGADLLERVARQARTARRELLSFTKPVKAEKAGRAKKNEEARGQAT